MPTRLWSVRNKLSPVTGRTSSTMNSLSNLPIEIVESIFCLLCPHCERPAHEHALPVRDPDSTVNARFGDLQKLQETRQALRALSLSCRVLRSVAQPVLFHIAFDCQRPSASTPFSSVVAARPNFEQAVRVLEIRGRCRRLGSLPGSRWTISTAA